MSVHNLAIVLLVTQTRLVTTAEFQMNKGKSFLVDGCKIRRAKESNLRGRTERRDETIKHIKLLKLKCVHSTVMKTQDKLSADIGYNHKDSKRLCLSVRPSVHLSVCPSVHRSDCPSTRKGGFCTIFYLPCCQVLSVILRYFTVETVISDSILKGKCNCCYSPGGGLDNSKEDHDESEGKDWPYTCSHYCNGDKQSPIDICSESAKAETGSITFSSSYSDLIPKLEIKNNGHTVGASWDSSLDLRTITDGGLTGVYALAQFHFHWGCENNRGSEHTVDGTRYAMELHLVHYKTEYGNLSNALKYEDGLAVLGVFFDVDDENAALMHITDNLEDIAHPDYDKTILTILALIDFIPANRDFYRYQGSLTTPTCNEVVIWTVFKTHQSFSEEQVKAFRMLEDHEGHMCDNYRGIQPLNGR
ncbi:unnamed protein product, partial [Meganyctiphanes norvegica]